MTPTEAKQRYDAEWPALNAAKELAVKAGDTAQAKRCRQYLSKLSDTYALRFQLNKESTMTLFNIVETDNFDGDYPDEAFLLFPMTQADAQAIADIANRAAGGETSYRYWKVVPLGYVLRPGFKP